MIRLDVRDLEGSPGASRAVRLAERVEGLRTELAGVPAPVRLDLVLEAVAEGIVVAGRVSAEVEISCARCLAPARRPLEVGLDELFAADADEDRYPLREGEIDLEPMVRDAVILALPFSPLCRPDCRGLCERCGGDRNLGECSCPPPADPRWAPLGTLELD